MMNSTNVVWQHYQVAKKSRAILKKQTPCIVWLTGLSGSGKSTIAGLVEQKLFELGCHTYLLDGDNVRHGINQDLGFSDSDRVENIRRVGEMAKLFADAGIIVLTAFISPFKADRQMVRELVDEGEFIEVFMDASLETCEKRDPKGLYKKARAGQIKNFTGIDSEYQKPENPEVSIPSSELSIEESADLVVDYLLEQGFISRV